MYRKRLHCCYLYLEIRFLNEELSELSAVLTPAMAPLLGLVSQTQYLSPYRENVSSPSDLLAESYLPNIWLSQCDCVHVMMFFAQASFRCRFPVHGTFRITRNRRPYCGYCVQSLNLLQ